MQAECKCYADTVIFSATSRRFCKYFDAQNIGHERHFEAEFREGLFPPSATQIFPRCDIREEISHACVCRISRDRTNELERFRGESEPLIRLSFVAPCVAKVAKKRAGKLPPVRSHNEGPQTCSTSSHNTWTGDGLTHMARSRRVERPLPLTPLGVKLNFGYTGCAKCLSRALRWSAFWSRESAS